MTAGSLSIQSDVLRRLAAYWEQLSVSRRPPARADFDPLDVPFAIGYVSIIEVHRDPLRFYFRLDGTKQVDLFGIDCTRRYLDETMPPDHAALAVRTYVAVMDSGAPECHVRKVRFHERMIDYEILILPFTGSAEDGNGIRVDYLITGIVPDYRWR
jgi:hypothetical protein